jgi:hypothetical protein
MTGTSMQHPVQGSGPMIPDLLAAPSRWFRNITTAYPLVEQGG